MDMSSQLFSYQQSADEAIGTYRRVDIVPTINQQPLIIGGQCPPTLSIKVKVTSQQIYCLS